MYNHIFIIGAPRSGTSWLHKLIGSHPKVASSVEINFFHKYLRPVLDAWNHEVKINETGQWQIGLPVLFSAEERDEYVSKVLATLYGRIAQADPAITHVLDKHPGNTFEVNTIRKYLPQAKFIHIIRDGRRVARSLVRINRDMGPMFGSATLDNAAWQWEKYVSEAITYRGQPWYLEVKYERLLEDGKNELKRIFDHCGLENDTQDIERILDRWGYENMKKSEEEYFKATHFGNALPVNMEKYGPLEGYCLDKIQGSLMRELGYVNDNSWWAHSAFDRIWIPLRHKLLLFLKQHPYIS